MPNWCFNYVEISGPNETLNKIQTLMKETVKKKIQDLSKDHGELRIAEDDYFSLLETFLPASEYFLSMEGFNNGGYEWCVDNWGTKWPEKILSSWLQNENWKIQFETAWAPPMSGYYAISKIFSDLMFLHYYEDEGWNFAGTEVYQNGICIYRSEISTNDLPVTDEDYEEEGIVLSLREMSIKKARESYTFSF